MPLTQGMRDGHALLQIRGELTIFQAARFKEQMLDAIDSAGDLLELDLSTVEKLDTAGLQLLLLLQRETVAQHKRLIVSNVSVQVQTILDMLHLQKQFAEDGPRLQETS